MLMSIVWYLRTHRPTQRRGSCWVSGGLCPPPDSVFIAFRRRAERTANDIPMAQGGLHAFLHLGDRHLTRMDEMLQTQWSPLPLTLVTRHGIPPNSLVDDFVNHLCHCFRLPGKHRFKLLGDVRGLSVARMGKSLQREFKGRTHRASRAGRGRDSGSPGWW